MGNNLLSKFRNLISSEETKVSTRQYFYVSFSLENKNDDLRASRASLSNQFDFLKAPFDNSLDFGLWVQTFNLPNLTLDTDGEVKVKNNRGVAIMPGDSLLVPDSNTVSIGFLETENPIIENVFVPWLERVASVPKNSSNYPFIRAKIYVDLLRSENPHDENKILTYVLHGAYPSFVTLPELSQASSSNMTRSVTFTFNTISILPGKLMKTEPMSQQNPPTSQEERDRFWDVMIERALKKGKEVLENNQNIF